jgi:hypothetical protein
MEIQIFNPVPEFQLLSTHGMHGRTTVKPGGPNKSIEGKTNQSRPAYINLVQCFRSFSISLPPSSIIVSTFIYSLQSILEHNPGVLILEREAVEVSNFDLVAIYIFSG